ncbi:MAG: transposase [candidate division NC10 bacterium]|nr:transposase [candidate division NC10 bacterium]
MGDAKSGPVRLSFNPQLRVEFRGSTVTSDLGNLLRRLALPLAIQSWSLTSLRQRLFKTGGRLIRHARYFILQLAESHLTRRLFGQILGRIERLVWHPI